MQGLVEAEWAASLSNQERHWPLDARMAIFVLEASGKANATAGRPRTLSRQPCRIIATLHSSDPHSLAHAIIYVRDLNDGHLGFISQTALPVGQSMWLNCSDPNGRAIRSACKIGRVRTFTAGWQEGMLQLCTSPAMTALSA